MDSKSVLTFVSQKSKQTNMQTNKPTNQKIQYEKAKSIALGSSYTLEESIQSVVVIVNKCVHCRNKINILIFYTSLGARSVCVCDFGIDLVFLLSCFFRFLIIHLIASKHIYNSLCIYAHRSALVLVLAHIFIFNFTILSAHDRNLSLQFKLYCTRAPCTHTKIHIKMAI